MHDVSNIYRVPLLLQHQGATHNLLARLALVAKPNAKLLSDWTSLAELVDSLKTPVTIAVVGKYTNLSDAYLSISKARVTADSAVTPTIRTRAVLVTYLSPS